MDMWTCRACELENPNAPKKDKNVITDDEAEAEPSAEYDNNNVMQKLEQLGWRTISDGDVNLETTVEILKQMIREQRRVRISSEMRETRARRLHQPYEGTVNRVMSYLYRKDDPPIIGLSVPEYYIPYPGEPNRTPHSRGGPYSGEYFHLPIKIEIWEEPKRPKSAMKTGRKKRNY